MKISEVMTRDVISVNVPGRRKKALEIMQKYNVSGLPVVEEKTKRLVGIITLDDLLKNPDEEQIGLLMKKCDFTAASDVNISEISKIFMEQKTHFLPVVENDKLAGVLTVEDIVKRGISKMESEKYCSEFMKTSVTCAWQGTPLPQILKIMEYSGSLAVVILDDGGMPAGVIDSSDLIRYGEIVSETEKTPMSNFTGDDMTWETKNMLYIGTKKLRLPRGPVKSYISGDIYYVSPSTTVTECARLMRRHDIEQLPVLDEKNDLVGIVRDVDVLKILE